MGLSEEPVWISSYEELPLKQWEALKSKPCAQKKREEKERIDSHRPTFSLSAGDFIVNRGGD